MFPRTQSWVKAHQLEVSIFLFALILRLVIIAVTPTQELTTYWAGSDGRDYVNEAQQLVMGHGFTRSQTAPYIPDASRTPLYPLMLAGTQITFGSVIPILLFEALLSSLLPLLFLRTAGLLVRNRKVLTAGAFFIAVEPHLLYNTIFFASESLSIILLSWGMLELLRIAYRPLTSLNWQSGKAGVSLGLATLARPITVYIWLLVGPLFGYQAYRKKQWRPFIKALGIFLVAFTLVLSPWVIRNYAVFGNAGMATNGWFNMYTRLAVTVVAIDTKQDFYTVFYQMIDDLSVRGYVHHPPPVSEIEIRDPRFEAIFRTETFRVIREHPRAFIIYLITAPISILTQDNTLGYISSVVPFTYNHPSFSPTLYASQHGPVALVAAVTPYLFGPYIVPYIMRALFTVLFICSAGGAALLWRRGERFAAILLFGWICYVILFSINAAGQISGRYRAQFLIAETALAAVLIERLVAVEWHRLGSTLRAWRSKTY